jgi:hypothetical protein
VTPPAEANGVHACWCTDLVAGDDGAAEADGAGAGPSAADCTARTTEGGVVVVVVVVVAVVVVVVVEVLVDEVLVVVNPAPTCNSA